VANTGVSLPPACFVKGAFWQETIADTKTAENIANIIRLALNNITFSAYCFI
jgi:hypothetical protein